jgi:pimeloyl-ACP methyl ester carboxylesterase
LYWQNLKRIHPPVLALLGETDGVFNAERLGKLLRQYAGARVHIIPNASHMGVVFNKQAHTVLADWLKALDEPED